MHWVINQKQDSDSNTCFCCNFTWNQYFMNIIYAACNWICKVWLNGNIHVNYKCFKFAEYLSLSLLHMNYQQKNEVEGLFTFDGLGISLSPQRQWLAWLLTNESFRTFGNVFTEWGSAEWWTGVFLSSEDRQQTSQEKERRTSADQTVEEWKERWREEGRTPDVTSATTTPQGPLGHGNPVHLHPTPLQCSDQSSYQPGICSAWQEPHFSHSFP